MRKILLLLLAAGFTWQAKAQDADSLSYTLPNGRVLHFESADQKAKFLAARERMANQGAAAAAPTPAVNAPSAVAPAPASAGAAVDKKWKLVWSDEFNGDKLDPIKWEFEVNGKGGGNNELQYYTDRPQNLSVHDGKMVITAAKEKFQGPDGKKDYTSARIFSKEPASWQYGRFEARIKMPKGKGLWPAFWMLPTAKAYGEWPLSGEIDITEVIGDKPNISYGTLHYGDKWPHDAHSGDKVTLPAGDFSDDFHVYSVEWQAGEIRWYLDGKLFGTQTQWRTASAPFPAPFNQKFHFLFNVAVGGAWPGPPNAATVFPQMMEVDWVRAYQLATP